MSKWIRQLHRWLAIALTLAILINGVTVFRGHYVVWMGLSAVGLLFLMLLTGLYLFVLPYAVKWRGRLVTHE